MKMMFLYVVFLCKVNINIQMITLQLLVNQECPTIFAFRRNSLDLLATTRVITCTCVRNCTKNRHFHVFLEFSVFQYIETIFLGKKIKPLAGFELASSI